MSQHLTIVLPDVSFAAAMPALLAAAYETG
jgi:hypothetical protein